MNTQNSKDDIRQAAIARWQAQAAEESEHRRREGKIAIWGRLKVCYTDGAKPDRS